MKRLTLIRHAKADWGDASQADVDRPLNERGYAEAPLIGQRMNNCQLKPQIILCSPATRATETAIPLARTIGMPLNNILLEKEIYNASMSDLLEIVRNVDNDFEHIALLGHNPSLVNLGNYLSNEAINDMPTCGVVCLEFATNSWDGLTSQSGTLIYFDYPGRPEAE
jgi:phosphohistidine phosphatase